MRIDRSGLPFIAAAAVPACAAAFWRAPTAALALASLPAAIALFFRDPPRTPPDEPRVVVAPADGRVMHAGDARADEAPPGRWQQVTIFLSVFDVHINRSPVAGRVTDVRYVPGTFRPAYRHDAHRNEHSEIWLDAGGVAVVVRQVAGLLARRVVCRVAPGEVVPRGGRIGLMKFGSRMDVFVPPTATLAVTTGARVRGGESVVARLVEGET
ncbi:MAG TPA: phosphatidylserine decarboxylase [Vicinamibacterales bacterium]|nr:phosphatidylserine decarboxylase [Vicinamibacterales bacterium]